MHNKRLLLEIFKDTDSERSFILLDGDISGGYIGKTTETLATIYKNPGNQSLLKSIMSQLQQYNDQCNQHNFYSFVHICDTWIRGSGVRIFTKFMMQCTHFLKKIGIRLRIFFG